MGKEEVALAKSKRLISLDVFRGITIAGMILVNNPGSWSYLYKPLGHAKWHGWTPTDLIFPFFLFIVGVAMTFSFDRRLSRGDSKNTLFLHVLRRSVILFILGLILAGFPKFNLSTIRIPGVLQRIAVCYLFASIIVMHTTWKGRLFWAIFFIALYWNIVALIPAPEGYTAAVTGKEGLLHDFIDSKIVGSHVWRERPDPEGILSTMPAISTTLLGVLTGNWLHSARSHLEKTVGMFIMANVGVVLGIIMATWFPINKKIWTSSYVVFTAGMALHFLAMCYWLIEIKGYKKWAYPFVVYGTNAITVFFASGIMARLLYLVKVPGPDGDMMALKNYIYDNFYASWAGPLNGSLFFAISYIILWFLLLLPLYKNKIFIKI
jgi:predicted acyltransferase